jgi:hypothetical protein
MAGPTIGTVTGGISLIGDRKRLGDQKKPGVSPPGVFSSLDQNGGRSNEWRALSSVVTKYSSRSRSNFS